MDQDCLWCCKPCLELCPKCGLVAFCSQDHLANHYNKEDGTCLPFRIRYSPNKGRYAVAIKTIEPCQLILKDWPLVVGPSRQQLVVCVECLKPCDGLVTCGKCQLPLCQDKCISKGQWHSLECEFLLRNGFKASLYSEKKADKGQMTDLPPLLVQLASITPLRLILQGSIHKPRGQFGC